jgi:integrase
MTGLRRNEAATLRWVDVDFEARTLTIREEIAKNHREHKLPLSEFLFSLLSRRKQETADSEYVFPGRYGGHMVSYIRQINSKVAAQSRCPFCLHDLRRTFISMGAKLGIQHHLTKRLLNHIGDKDDTDEYIIISTEHLREPMEQISRRFLELMGADPSRWGTYPAYRNNYRLVTLQEVLDRYLASKLLSPNSRRAYRNVLNQRLPDWLDMPVTSLTPEMIERRHHEISYGNATWKASKVQANQAMATLKALLNWAADNYEIEGKPLIAANPVRILRQRKRWHFIPARQSVVPDEKLPDWYQAVMSLTARTPRDLLLVAMFTGLCHADIVNMVWSDVDLKTKVLSIRSKRKRLHLVPLSDFLLDLCTRRYSESNSVYVFPGRAGLHIKQFHQVMEQVWEKCGFKFTVQDLRRTFLYVAERLELPLYAIRALSNQSERQSALSQHREFDVEQLRGPMQQITDHFLRLMRQEGDGFNRSGWPSPYPPGTTI